MYLQIKKKKIYIYIYISFFIPNLLEKKKFIPIYAPKLLKKKISLKSLGMKNKFHTNFMDKNNTLAY